MDEYTKRSELRKSIAKEFLDILQSETGDWLVRAYIYGSTARNSCRELSDIDILLITKKDFTFIHDVALVKFFLEDKYGIPIHPLFHYDTDSIYGKIRSKLSENDFYIFSLFQVLDKPHLVYPEHFINVAYVK